MPSDRVPTPRGSGGLTPRRAVATLLLGLVGAGLGLGLLGEAELEPTPTDGLPTGAESTRVVELQSQFEEAGESVAVVLYTADEGELSQTEVRELGQSFASATGSRVPLQPSDDGTLLVAPQGGPGRPLTARRDQPHTVERAGTGTFPPCWSPSGSVSSSWRRPGRATGSSTPSTAAATRGWCCCTAS